jgi:hypothetical protein
MVKNKLKWLTEMPDQQIGCVNPENVNYKACTKLHKNRDFCKIKYANCTLVILQRIHKKHIQGFN